MPNQNDLDSPLGQKPNKSGQSSSAYYYVFLILAVAGVSSAATYIMRDRIWDSGTKIASYEEAITDKITVGIIPKTTKKEPIIKPSITSGGNNSNGLEELDPSGSLIVPRIAPRKPKAQVRQKQILAHLPDAQLAERGATGVIPKLSKDGLRPMDVYSRQPLTEGNVGVARVVIVIAGLGISQTSTQLAIKKLPGAITLAFAPYGNSLSRWMQSARRAGHELLLQVPMEPYGYPQNNPGVHTLTIDAGVEENLANLHWSMSRITNYVGIMNYLGGKLVSDTQSLKPIFDEIASRGLLFFEDGTVKNSAGKLAAGRSLLP